MMKMALDIVVKKYRHLSEHELAEIVNLCSRAYETDYRPFLDTFIDPTHVLGYFENILVSHALWITRWLQVEDSPLMRTAFVEGVATEKAYRKKGFASAVISRLTKEITDYDIGGLCTGSPDFYSSLGWKGWKGPLFTRKNDELVPSQEEASVMILALPNTPELDLVAPLSIEWREGEVW